MLSSYCVIFNNYGCDRLFLIDGIFGMKNLVVIVLLLLGQQCFASENSAQAELSYDAIMQNKFQHQAQLNEVNQSLIAINEREASTLAEFYKHSQFAATQELDMYEAQQLVSFDKVYAVLGEYQKLDNDNSLTGDDRVKMNRLDANLNDFQQLVKKILSQAKNVTMTQILQNNQGRQIYTQLQLDCFNYKSKKLSSCRNSMSQCSYLLENIALQKKLKTEEQSAIVATLAKMNELSDAFAVQQDKAAMQALPFNTKAIITLQSLYRMQQVRNGHDVQNRKIEQQQRKKTMKIAEMAQVKASIFKNKLADSVVDFILQQAFLEIDENEHVRLHDEQIRLQAEQQLQAQENKRLQEQVFVPVTKKQSKKKQSMVQVHRKQVSSQDEDDTFLDAAIAENKAVASLLCHNKPAENKIVDSKSIMKLMHQYCNIIGDNKNVDTKDVLQKLLDFIAVAEPVQRCLQDSLNPVYKSIDPVFISAIKDSSDEWRKLISPYNLKSILHQKALIEKEIDKMKALCIELQDITDEYLNASLRVSQCQRLIKAAEIAQIEFNRIDRIYDIFRIVAVLDTIQDRSE